MRTLPFQSQLARLLGLCALLCFLPLDALFGAVIIGVNFRGSSTSATYDLLPTDSVGAVASQNWNNVGTDGGGGTQSFSNMVDNTGAATTTDIALGGIDFTYNNNTDVTGTTIVAPFADDAKMMGSARGSSSNGGNRTITVTSVTLALYDVYVYFGGANANASVPYVLNATLQSFNGSIYVDATPTYYMRDGNRTWDGTYDQSTATDAASAVDGQEYVLFQNVSLDHFRINAVSVGRRAGFSGIQIVEVVPEPGASALLVAGLAGLGASFRVRRR